MKLIIVIFLIIFILLTPVYYSANRGTIHINDILTINLIGNGSVILHLQNGTEEELTTSTSIKVSNGTYVWITSTVPFMVDRCTMVTNYFGENVTANTVWDITFNPKMPQEGYTNITVVLLNQGVVNMVVYNDTTRLTLVAINHTESFLVPKGYSISFYSNEKFLLIDKNEGYSFSYHYGTEYLQYFDYRAVEHNITAFIVFYIQQQTIVTTPSNTTLTVTIPVVLNNSQHNTINALTVLLQIILIISAVHILMKEFRKKKT